MKKYKLRDHFSIEVKGEVIVGPAIVELSDEQHAADQHKLESVVENSDDAEKKAKAEAEEKAKAEAEEKKRKKAEEAEAKKKAKAEAEAKAKAEAEVKAKAESEQKATEGAATT